MVQIQVKISADLRNIRIRTVELAGGTDAMGLIQQLGIPVEEVGVLSVNGQQATFDQALHAGDVVHIVPPIGGG
jgi:molybdopterin synthase sulfur carrier subunit